MEAVLGAELMVHRDGKVSRMPTAAALAGKRFVALYFSAHWCGPCRKFTPLLSVCYEDQPEKDEVEVVFVSSDHDVEGFDEYFGEMPWSAVPFDAAGREEMGEKFGVTGIPRVIVLDARDASVVNSDARALIAAKKTLGGVFQAAPAAAGGGAGGASA